WRAGAAAEALATPRTATRTRSAPERPDRPTRRPIRVPAHCSRRSGPGSDRAARAASRRSSSIRSPSAPRRAADGGRRRTLPRSIA
ncbi:MAG: hypothetical protein AVDCRST_MAG45-1688, partial [uncultured Solirubrobacterales bacterium]